MGCLFFVLWLFLVGGWVIYLLVKQTRGRRLSTPGWVVRIAVGSKVGWVETTDERIRSEVWTPSDDIDETDVVRWVMSKNVPPRQIVGIERVYG